MQFITRTLLSILLLGLETAAQVSFNSTLPDINFKGTLSGVSKKCVAAYAAPITCPDLLFKLRSATAGPPLFTAENLQSLCSDDCIKSLNSWDKNVVKECDNESDLIVLEDPTGRVPEYFRMVIRGKHEVQENLYWPFCLKDHATNDFCLLKSGLPAWNAEPTVLCNDHCRVEQSYLAHNAAGGREIAVFDAPAKCPELDTAAFEIKVIFKEAFGEEVADDAKKSPLPKVDGLKMEGTDYEVEKMFDTQLVAGNAGTNSTAGSNPDDGSGAQGSPAAAGADDNSGARRVRASAVAVLVGLLAVVIV